MSSPRLRLGTPGAKLQKPAWPKDALTVPGSTPACRPQAPKGQAQFRELPGWQGPQKGLAQPLHHVLSPPSTCPHPRCVASGGRVAGRGPSARPGQAKSAPAAEPRRCFGKTTTREDKDIPPHLPPSVPQGEPALPGPAPPHLPLAALPPAGAGLSGAVFMAITGQETCLFILQPVVLLRRPHGNSPGSPAPPRKLPRTCPCPLQPLLEGDREGEQRRQGWRRSRRMPGLRGRTRPLLVILGPAGGPTGGQAWAAAEPHPGAGGPPGQGWSQAGPTPGPGSVVSGANWSCPPAGPPRDLPPEPEATCQPHGCPTPLSSGPAPLPSPTAAPAATANCRPVPFQALTPTVLPKHRCQPPAPDLPEPQAPPPRPRHQGPAFQTCPSIQGRATPALCPGRGAGV